MQPAGQVNNQGNAINDPNAHVYNQPNYTPVVNNNLPNAQRKPLTLIPLGRLDDIFPKRTISKLAVPYEKLSDAELNLLQGATRQATVRRIREIEGIQTELTGISARLCRVLQAFPQEGAVNGNEPNDGESSLDAQSASRSTD